MLTYFDVASRYSSVFPVGILLDSNSVQAMEVSFTLHVRAPLPIVKLFQVRMIDDLRLRISGDFSPFGRDSVWSF